MFGVINPNLTEWKRNLKVQRNKLDNLNVMKGAANEQSCHDALWEDLSSLNTLAQVINLFNSIFIKVQLMLDIRRGRKEKWKTLIPEVVFINNLEKIADPLRLFLVIFLKSFCYYYCGKILVTFFILNVKLLKSSWLVHRNSIYPHWNSSSVNILHRCLTIIYLESFAI